MTTAPVPADDWYDLRPATPAELKFIVETTARVMMPHPDATGRRRVSVVGWLDRAVPSISATLDPNAMPVVAADGDVVVGFCLLDRGRLAMLYVKKEFRGNRVGLRLLWASGVDTEGQIQVTNHTRCWEAWTKHHGLSWRRVD